MAEWPKTISQAAQDAAKRGVKGKVESGLQALQEKVIPADLGRELYEELKFADRAVHEERGTGDYQPCDAIARYEKEIGE